MPDVKQIGSFLLLLTLTGCAHLTRQEWHDVLLGPRAQSYQELRQEQFVEKEPQAAETAIAKGDLP